MEGSLDPMLVVGADGRVMAANSPALLLLGKESRKVCGKHIETVVKLRRQNAGQVAHPARDTSSVAASLHTLKREGQPATTVLVKKTHGSASRTLWVLREVPPSQPSSSALAQKTRFLLEAERVGRIAGWEFDPATRTIFWTEELQRLMGTHGETMTVEHSNSFYVGVSREIVREAFKATVAEGTPYDLELEVMTGDGRRIWIREVCRPTFRRGRLVSVFGVVQDISESKYLAALLAQSADRERTRIAADLHDGVGQELTGLAFELAGAAAEYRRESPAAARDMARCAKTARDALAHLREISHALLPLELRELGFDGLCRELTAAVRGTAGARAQFRFRGDPAYMPTGSTAEHLYRIAQEAIANAIKHGAARRIIATLTADRSRLLWTISDDGSGMKAVSKKPGVGIQIMRYRTRLIGGVLTLKPLRQGGIQVRCVVPSGGAEPVAPDARRQPHHTAKTPAPKNSRR
jgi:PAS domain S-box-containing protein